MLKFLGFAKLPSTPIFGESTMTLDYQAELKKLTLKVAQLEAENSYLKKLVEISTTHDAEKIFQVEYLANSKLKDAVEKINSNKWVEASEIIAKQYGTDFMMKESVSFSILKKAMYEFYKMPEAPERFDKSTLANEIRERRKNIRATVYTYIDRMGNYYLKKY